MAIQLTYNNNIVNTSDSIKDFVGKYNNSSKEINIDLNEIKKSIDTLEDNTYVRNLIGGYLIRINSLDTIGSSTFGGDVLFRFGKDNKSNISINEDGIILDDRNKVSDGIKGALVFTLDNTELKDDSDIPYQDVNISTSELNNGQVIILRIDDNSHIYGNVHVKLVGYEDEQVLELSPNRPSIILMKSFDGDDRFLVLSYPLIRPDGGGASSGFGKPGKDGLSAYELALKNELTDLDEISWLESLNGKNGKSAYEIWKESPLNVKGEDATKNDYFNNIIQNVLDRMSDVTISGEWVVIE